MRGLRHNIFGTGFMLTIGVSLALFALLGTRGEINWLAMVTIIGAPVACWLLWLLPSKLVVRVGAPLLFVATVFPAIASLIAVLYVPGLVAVLVGPVPARLQRSIS